MNMDEDDGDIFFHWIGNVAEDGRFVSDGHLILDLELCHLAAYSTLRWRDGATPQRATQNKCASLMRKWADSPGLVGVEVTALYRGKDALWGELELTRSDGVLTTIMAEKWTLALGSCGFDHAMQARNPLGPVLLFKGDELAGLLMPMKPIPEAFDQRERIFPVTP